MVVFMITVSEVEKMPHLEATVISYSGAISACEKAAPESHRCTSFFILLEVVEVIL